MSRSKDLFADEQEMLKACPHFGPSPARDQWIAGWEAARRSAPAPVAQPAGESVNLEWVEPLLPAIRHRPGMHNFACYTLNDVRAAVQTAKAAPAPVAQTLTDQQIDALSDEVFDLIADMPDADVGSRTWDRMFARAVIAKIESTGQEGGAA